uniref:Uncharacterized protein n=1 Tax=Branchiostoma floridae TaxID=7739 RepID=C3Y9B8_BRAFL|eukprot:XP_002607164.1 hypothetical protein BRAFLDRAFT_68041 [Branchiostoma floridae]
MKVDKSHKKADSNQAGQMRGKFRPRLQQLVESNMPEVVEETSRKAFNKLPNISSAINELSKLKAVGPATATAILAAAAPELVPFMADESMLSTPGLGPVQYTLPLNPSHFCP